MFQPQYTGCQHNSLCLRCNSLNTWVSQVHGEGAPGYECYEEVKVSEYEDDGIELHCLE